MPKSLRTSRQQRLLSLLVEARKAKSLTQAEIAAALGRPQSFVAKYENDERRIDVIEFVDIAAAIGVSAAEILKKIESTAEAPKRTGGRKSQPVR